MKWTSWLITGVLATGLGFVVLTAGSQIVAGQESGAEYGKIRSVDSCFLAVLSGAEECHDSASCYLRSQSFLNACLETARPSTSFCRTLPQSFGNLLAVEIWKKRQCEALNRDDRSCHRIQLAMLNACDTD